MAHTAAGAPDLSQMAANIAQMAEQMRTLSAATGQLGRQLGVDTEDKSEEFNAAAQAAQIFSGVMFGCAVMYLVFSNSTRLSYIRRASLEKRLTTACQINVIVAAFSTFLNFYQVTAVDDWELPGGRDSMVDTSRLIEWILTCPLMQLNLVLIGGSRIPESRLILMPGICAFSLLFAGSTLFVEEPYNFVLFGCGFCLLMIQWYFNRQQIVEHSRGMEGLLVGDSEFRKATLILMITWTPFPIWYFLSPEGTGVLNDVGTVQMGWAFLNIVSKFTMIFYTQRMKDTYCNRLKVKREMKGSGGNVGDIVDEEVNENDPHVSKQGHISGELRACIMETMGFLGMSENMERFVRLLQEASILTMEDLSNLCIDECERLQIPWDLVSALQKRQKMWALEMVDDAEKGLEKGEKHYKKTHQDIVKDGDNKSNNVVTSQQGVTSPVGNSMAIVIPSAAPQPFVTSPMNFGDAKQQQQSLMGANMAQQMEPGFGYYNHQDASRNVNGFMDANDSRRPSTTTGNEAPPPNHHQVMPPPYPPMNLPGQHADYYKFATAQDVQAAAFDKNRLAQLEERLMTFEERILTRFDRFMQEMEGRPKGSNVVDKESSQETKTSFITLQTKLGVLEEMQKRKLDEFEERFTAKVQKILDESIKTISDMTMELSRSSEEMIERKLKENVAESNVFCSNMINSLDEKVCRVMRDCTQSCSQTISMTIGNETTKTEQKLIHSFKELRQDGHDALITAIGNENILLEQKMALMVQEQVQRAIAAENLKFEKKLTDISRDLNQDCTKGIESSVSLIGNTLRMQLEGVQLQTIKGQDTLSALVEQNIREYTDKAARRQENGLLDLQTYMEVVMSHLGIKAPVLDDSSRHGRRDRDRNERDIRSPTTGGRDRRGTMSDRDEDRDRRDRRDRDRDRHGEQRY